MMIKMWHNGIAYQTKYDGVYYAWSEHGDGWHKRISQALAKKEFNAEQEADRVVWVKLIDGRGIAGLE